MSPGFGRFEVADFRNLSKSFNEKFDAILCVGNSLPHLTSDADLTKALGQNFINFVRIVMRTKFEITIQ